MMTRKFVSPGLSCWKFSFETVCLSFIACFILDLSVSAKFPNAVPKLVKMTLNDKDGDVRLTGVKSLTSLAQAKNGSFVYLINLTSDLL